MKKSLSMLLAGMMLVGTLAGCGGNTASTDNAGSEDGSTASGAAFKTVSYTHLDVYKRQDRDPACRSHCKRDR